MGKPLFKASDGGRLEILWVTEPSLKVKSAQVGDVSAPPIRRSPRSLSDRFTHARKRTLLCNIWLKRRLG